MRVSPGTVLLSSLILALAACTFGFTPVPPPAAPGIPPTVPPQAGIQGEQAVVTRVIDGDTIEVRMNGVGYRIRYLAVNTPERDETCYEAAAEANARLVENQVVTMVRDVENTDRYGRLLRYVYVGDRFVNALLVAGGHAEAVEYPPNVLHTAYMRELEQAAAALALGCHSTGIFNDGSQTR